MSHDDTNDTSSLDDPFETGASAAHVIDARESASGKTSLIETGFAYRAVDSGRFSFIDPKGESRGDIQCPLNDHPSTSETQNATGDNAAREGGGESS